VLGDGGWGTTLAIHLHRRGCRVTLWGAFPEYISLLKKERVNSKFLPGVKIPEKITLTSDLKNLEKDEIVLIAVPTRYLRKVINSLKEISGRKIVSATKGIEADSLKRPSEVITDVSGNKTIAALSGPSISYEVVRGLPTTVVAASQDEKFATEIQALFSDDNFRVYTSDDITGVELGGALKNIVAIAAGICDGMGFGANTKAALLTRGLAEIVRLGCKIGARKETFFGLSGLGDLVTTCVSSHSRNRWFGEQIGKGRSSEEILSRIEMVVEGITTVKSAYRLAKKLEEEMPITEKIYETLYSGKKPQDAVKELMSRAPKKEKL